MTSDELIHAISQLLAGHPTPEPDAATVIQARKNARYIIDRPRDFPDVPGMIAEQRRATLFSVACMLELERLHPVAKPVPFAEGVLR
jgi:hypothetical protein